MKFLTELSNRWTEGSPKFFKTLISFGLYLSGLGTSLLLIPGIPEKMSTMGGYLLTAGGVIAAVAKLPVKDPENLPK